MNVTEIRRTSSPRSFNLSDARGGFWLDAGAVLASALRAGARAIRQLGRSIVEGHQASIAYRQLSMLSDRDLADIGLSRGDIPRVVSEYLGGSREAAPGAVKPAATATREAGHTYREAA